MNKVQIFRNHMAEKGFEYTIEEASALMEEMETLLDYIGKLSLPQFLSINKTLSENKRRTLIDHLKCTEEEFEKLLELIIDIRGL
jgi:hypothetical protein